MNANNEGVGVIKAIYDYLTCSSVKVWHRESTNEWVVEVQTVTDYVAHFSRYTSRYKVLAWVKTVWNAPKDIKMINESVK